MAATLSKTRMGLAIRDGEGDPVFGYDDPDWSRTTEVRLDADVWHEMDEPRFITVTVEPGDDLNRETDREPLLGYATTQELIQELAARAEVSATIGEAWPSYRTVDADG